MWSQTGLPEADTGHHPAAHSQEYPCCCFRWKTFHYKHATAHSTACFCTNCVFWAPLTENCQHHLSPFPWLVSLADVSKRIERLENTVGRVWSRTQAGVVGMGCYKKAPRPTRESDLVFVCLCRDWELIWTGACCCPLRRSALANVVSSFPAALQKRNAILKKQTGLCSQTTCNLCKLQMVFQGFSCHVYLPLWVLVVQNGIL